MRTFTTTVKVRFQDPGTSARYSSTLNALSTIVKEERFSGLYKGIMSPMVCIPVLVEFMEPGLTRLCRQRARY